MQTVVKSHKRAGRIVKSHMRQSGGSGMGSRRKLRKGITPLNVISDEGTRVAYAPMSKKFKALKKGVKGGATKRRG
jgi:hypothetical protein